MSDKKAIIDYWNKRPCNVQHSALPVGTREYFDEVERRKYFVEPHIPDFARFEDWEDRKVLEIGCGIGTDTINFARSGAFVTAVDLSDQSIAIASQRAEVFGLSDRINFVCGDAEELSNLVKPEVYDLIYSFGAIHHSPNPGKILDEIDEFMGIASVLKLMVYYRYSWKALSLAHFAPWLIDSRVATQSEAQPDCPVVHVYSKRQAKRLLEERFLRVESMSVEHIFPYKIEPYVSYRYEEAMPWKRMPEKMFRGLEHLFGWHLCITAQEQPWSVLSDKEKAEWEKS